MDEALKMVKMPMDEEHQEGKRGTVKCKAKRRKKCYAELWRAFLQCRKALKSCTQHKKISL